MNCSDTRCEIRGPELRLDEIQHQIERRRAARAGEAIAIDGEQLIADEHPGKLLAQGRQIFPVDGRPKIIQEARARERVAAGAQGAQRDPPVGQAPQRGEQRGRDGITNIDAAAHEQNIDRSQFIQSAGRGQREPAARIDRAAIQADDGPFVHVLADQAVGHAQGFERVGHGDQ